VDRLELKKRRNQRRRWHVRRAASGTSERPRLTVYKSLRHITAQVIDDSSGQTLAYWSTASKGAAPDPKKTSKTEAAKIVGQKVAELAKEKGVETVVFDRNRYLYHGRIKAVADGAREAGLKF